MMTSINPKITNISNNMNYSKIPHATNNLQKMNANIMPQEDMDKIKYNTNINTLNQNYNFKRYDELNNNINYNKQNNSINLNAGLNSQKNYSTPILNEGKVTNQDKKYERSFDFYDKSQKNDKIYNPKQNKTQNMPMFGNENAQREEIEKLKMEIMNLQKRNEYLNNQIMEEKRKNQEIQNLKDEKENEILEKVAQNIQVSSVDEILPKLNQIINYLNNNVNNFNQNSKMDKKTKIRDELISKMQNLYLTLAGTNEKKEDISIKILWRWIKHLINTVKQLATEKEEHLKIYQNIQEIDEFKEYCQELMNGFNMQSLDELKLFIDELLKQNNLIKDNEPQEQNRNIPIQKMNQQGNFQPNLNYPPLEGNDEGEEEIVGEEDMAKVEEIPEGEEMVGEEEMVEGEMEGEEGDEGEEGEMEGDAEGEEGINEEIELYDNGVINNKVNNKFLKMKNM